jgi:site-specific recombinase XerD
MVAAVRQNMHRGEKMPRKRAPGKHLGIFERPPGSGIWWINYYRDGKQHREKVGRRAAAITLREKRRTEILEKRKLPDLRNHKYVTVAELIDDLLEYVVHHKDRRSYESKAGIVKKALGGKKADDLKPQEIAKWLNSHCKTAATYNRYKAFLSLAYRLGEENDKVERNVARKAPHRTESNARVRFLSREDEYPRLHAAITKLFPEHIPEFVVSVHTGMRLSEQYSVEWPQVHLDRRAIDLKKTKNGHERTVHLNQDAIDAIASLKLPGQRMRGRVFPREGSKDRFDNRSWFVPCLEEANITGYLWHGNRHTFCSWLAMAGASTKEVQEAAGHKTITMAARYSHLSPAHRLSVVERITGAGLGGEHAPKRAPEENNVTAEERN